MIRDRFAFNLTILRHFINNSLGITDEVISGFKLNEPLLDAAAYNTYVETVGDKSDTLYRRIKESLTEMTTYSYLDYIRRLSMKYDWKSKNFILAFDYTDEDFYGEVKGFDIHGWKKTSPISGKFKFLTCSIVSDEIPQKIPLVSVPIMLGHYKSHVITHCLSLITQYIGKINLILFDRGFYDKDLMYELSRNKYPYLIFVPKSPEKKEILYPMEIGEQIAFLHGFEVNKDKSKYKGETFLTFLKAIYDKKSGQEYDWVFASNIQEVALSKLIGTYKKRWRIETSFRVQDEATIKCKSSDMKIRYFLFMYQQMLQSIWMCFFKEEVTFKEFIIGMHKTCKELVANPGKSYNKTQKH